MSLKATLKRINKNRKIAKERYYSDDPEAVERRKRFSANYWGAVWSDMFGFGAIWGIFVGPLLAVIWSWKPLKN